MPCEQVTYARMPRFHVVIVSLVVAAACTAGCGSASSDPSGSEVTSAARGDTGVVTDVLPTGPRDPAKNLARLLAQSTPRLHDVVLRCPKVGNPPDYPFRCGFKAADGKRHTEVSGVVSVYGVYAPTMTYVYETTWQPEGRG